MINPQLRKMDIMFYNSIQRNKSVSICVASVSFIHCLFFAIFLPIDILVLKTTNSPFIVFMAVALGFTSIILFINIAVVIVGYGNHKENNLKFLSWAQDGHSTTQIVQERQMDDLAACVSKNVYDQSKNLLIDDAGLTQDLKIKYENILGQYVEGQVEKQLSCVGLLDSMARLGMIVIFIYGIAALVTSQISYTSAQLGVTIAYLVFLFIFHWKSIFILIVIILLPFFLIVVCIGSCCCNKQNQEVNLPEAKPASMEILVSAETCSICQRSFTLNEKIIQLSCAPNHVYHEGCIQNWLRFGSTCPMCRQPIS